MHAIEILWSYGDKRNLAYELGKKISASSLHFENVKRPNEFFKRCRKERGRKTQNRVASSGPPARHFSDSVSGTNLQDYVQDTVR
jgi:hypothetical protein